MLRSRWVGLLCDVILAIQWAAKDRCQPLKFHKRVSHRWYLVQAPCGGAEAVQPVVGGVQQTIQARDHARTSVFIKTYGCQMNVSDSELVTSILTQAGYDVTNDESADIVLLNTCAIRDAAEQKVWGKVRTLQQQHRQSLQKRTVGVLGCMAVGLKDRLLDSQLVQVVAGDNLRIAVSLRMSAAAQVLGIRGMRDADHKV